MAISEPGRAWWRSALACGTVGGLTASAVLDVAGGRLVLVAVGLGALVVAVSPSGPLHHDRLGGERWYRFVAVLAALSCPAWTVVAHQVGVDGTARSAIGVAVWSASALVVVPALPVRDAVHGAAAAAAMAMLSAAALLAIEGQAVALIPLLVGATAVSVAALAVGRVHLRPLAQVRAAATRLGVWLRERPSEHHTSHTSLRSPQIAVRGFRRSSGPDYGPGTGSGPSRDGGTP